VRRKRRLGSLMMQIVTHVREKRPLRLDLFHQFHGWTVVSDKQATIDAFERASDSAKHTLTALSVFTATCCSRCRPTDNDRWMG